MTGIKHIGEISLITAQVDGMGADEMKSMADKIKAEVPNSVAVMGAETDGKITFVAMASKEAVKLGVHCGKIIKDITAVAGAAAAVSLIWRKAAAVTRARLMTRWLRLTKSLRNRLSN